MEIKKFVKFKQKTKKQRLNFKSNNTKSYNLPYTVEEQNESLKKAYDMAVGPDDIHYQFLNSYQTNHCNYC